MSQLQNAKVNQTLMRKYGNQRELRRIANALSTQDDANDFGQTLRDAAWTRRTMPVVWDLCRLYRSLMFIVGACAVAIGTLLMFAVLWSDQLVGAKLYAGLVVGGIATSIGIWAALRARAVRREDAQHPSMIDAAQVDDAAIFVRIFGTVGLSDGAGMLLLAVAGGIDAGLAGWIIASGLASSVPVIFLFAASILFATAFIAVLRWIAAKFETRCASIRARLWVRNLAKIDFERFPEKASELIYVRQALSALCNDDFSKPSIGQYAGATGLLLLMPAMFGGLIAYRIWIADTEGAADFAVVLGVSVLCGILATLAALLGAMGHLQKEQGVAKTRLHRRFPTTALFGEWAAAYARHCEQWANSVGTAINTVLRQAESDGDQRWSRRSVSVPRPFPPQGSHEPSARAAKVQSDSVERTNASGSAIDGLAEPRAAVIHRPDTRASDKSLTGAA